MFDFAKLRHKPFETYRKISAICLATLFPAFLMYLLVALSLPIIKSIYIVRVYAITDVPATSIATELRFGVWGVCASSAINPPNWYDNPGTCFGPQLGYTIPESISDLVGISPDIVKAVTTGLLVILILHPVVTGLSMVTFICSVFIATRTMAIVSLVTSIATAFVGSFLFLIDLVIVYVLKGQIGELTNDGFAASAGNALWLVLTAVFLSWIAVIVLSARACYCCGVRSKDKY